MQNQTLQLVSFEQAQKLKELGFDWNVYHWYNSDKSLSSYSIMNDRNNDAYGTSAPFIDLALKWFRDEKGYMQSIYVNNNLYYVGTFIESGDDDITGYTDKYIYHDDAECALLDKLIELEINKQEKIYKMD